VQRFERIGRDGPIGGEGVVNVCEYTDDFVARVLGPRREGLHFMICHFHRLYLFEIDSLAYVRTQGILFQ
jgi:hypothetical protein